MRSSLDAVWSLQARLDQRASKIAMHWLEPEAPDSAMQWGLLDAIFEQKEYGECYVLERLARKMIAAEPKLKQEFVQKLASDSQFAESPSARLISTVPTSFGSAMPAVLPLGHQE